MCREQRRLITMTGKWFQGDMAEATKETVVQLSQLKHVKIHSLTLE